jgi:hypothetical protein
MQIVYRAANLSDAHLIRQLMEAEGIPAFVQGEYLQGAVGELPANTEVLVRVPDEHVDAARAVVDDWENSEPLGFEDEDLDAEDLGATDAGEPTSVQTQAIAVRRLLLFVAILVVGVIGYTLLLRRAAG